MDDPCFTSKERFVVNQTNLQINQFHTNLLDLFENEILCDVELYASDSSTPIKCHKVVLSASSHFFNALFNGSGTQMKEGVDTSSCIHLQGIDNESLRSVLIAVYSNSIDDKCSLDHNTIGMYLAASTYLDIPSIRDYCIQSYLIQDIQLTNVIDKLMLADKYDCSDAVQLLVRYIQAHLVPLIQTQVAVYTLQNLSFELLLKILSSSDLEVNDEKDVVYCCAVWLLLSFGSYYYGQEYDVCTSNTAVTIDFSIISTLHGTVRATFSDQVYREAVQSAAKNLQLPLKRVDDLVDACIEGFVRANSNNTQIMLKDQVCVSMSSLFIGNTVVDHPSVFQPRHGSFSHVMAIGGIEDNWVAVKTVEFYDPLLDRWIRGNRSNEIHGSCKFATAATLRDTVYAIAGSSDYPLSQTYHRKKMVWSVSSRPGVSDRLNFATVAVSGLGQLYCVGGRHNISDSGRGRGSFSLSLVERYDVGGGDQHGGGWKVVGSMVHPRASLTACQIQESRTVYAIGGQDDRITHDTAEYYDAERDQWYLVQRKMPNARKYAGSVSVCGQLVVAGGVDAQRRRLSSVLGYDPREGLWRELPSLSSPTSSFGITALHGDVFIAGGSVGIDGHACDKMECYSASAGKWKDCAKMYVGRSGLALTPV